MAITVAILFLFAELAGRCWVCGQFELS